MNRTLALCALALVVGAAEAAPRAMSLPALRPKLSNETGPEGDLSPGRVLVRAKREALPALQQVAAGFVKGPAEVEDLGLAGWSLVRVADGADTVALANRLARVPGVVTAQPSYRVRPLLATPNDLDWGVMETRAFCFYPEGTSGLEFERLWNLTSIDAFNAWSIWPNQWYTAANKPSDMPLIAIVDTGCDMDHPDFRNGGSTASDVFGGQLDWARSGRYSDTVFTPGPVAAQDTFGHGTHVAGIALASGNNGGYNDYGMIGTGYAAKGLILSVFNDWDEGFDFDAALAVQYAADQGADVISLSLGTPQNSLIIQTATTYAFQKGSLVVAASNQSGAGGGDIGPIYPAASSASLAVNSFNSLRTQTSYTGYGTYVDIASPGGDYSLTFDEDGFPTIVFQYIWSTSVRGPSSLSLMNREPEPNYTEDYAYLLGNSMATPAVSGAAAHFFGRYGLGQNQWGNVRAYQALERSAIPEIFTSGGARSDVQGYGLLDMPALMNEANSRNSTLGGIEGIVYSGGGIANGARVDVMNGSTVLYSTNAGTDGTYRHQRVPAGTYRVRAFYNNSIDEKQVTVLPGADAPGIDFWIGGFILDDTDPEVPVFQLEGTPTASVVRIRHWAYDPETGIDKMTFRIGTTPGGADAMTDRDVPMYKGVPEFTGLSLQNGTTYYVRATYIAGADATINGSPFLRRTVRDLSFTLGGSTSRTVSGVVTLPGVDPVGRSVTIAIRAPGTTTALETKTVTLGVGGSFSFTTARSGSYDLAATSPYALRAVRASVNLAGTTVTGQNFTLRLGDCDQDNDVDIDDYDVLAGAYGSFVTGPADLDKDNDVDIDDYDVLANSYGRFGDD